jgi:NAD(P)H-hydrate repair Nnr-like enzyme with NAD(P)H-hydrate epimerase domain
LDFLLAVRMREPFKTLLEKIKGSGLPTLSVDIPSGWDVNKGDIHNTAFRPQGVISYAWRATREGTTWEAASSLLLLKGR